MSSSIESYALMAKEALSTCFKYHKFQNNNNENVLLMFSGGMDSVSLAWNLLQHTKQNVHIHAIHLDNSEKRCKAEAKAIYESINWLKSNQRPFEFSSSFYGWTEQYPGGRDMALAMFQAGRVINGIPKHFTAVYTGDYNTGKEETAEAYGILNATGTGRLFNPVWATPFDFMTQVSLQRSLGIYHSMAEPLRDMYWSCRKPKETPEGFLTCGICHACTRQYAMKKEIDKCQM